jgi:cytidine deaminase
MALSPAKLKALIAAAKRASQHAYSPYSRFRVGAAALGKSGAIAAGCNVENASYGLTICAERNAIFQCVARGARRIRAIAIYTPTPEPTPPCGACRQVLREFGDDIDVYCACDGTAILRRTIAELLPDAFGRETL